MSPRSGRTATINTHVICKSQKYTVARTSLTSPSVPAAAAAVKQQRKNNLSPKTGRTQQIRMFNAIKRDLSNDCAAFLLILLASALIAYIECDPGSSVFNKQEPHLWQTPFVTLTLDYLTNQIKSEQQQQQHQRQQQQLLECQLNNGINCQQTTMINYNNNNNNNNESKQINSERKPLRTTTATTTNTKRSITNRNDKSLDASHLLREIYLDADSMVLLLPGTEEKDSSSVQKFHPNGRYGRRSSNDFPIEPYHEEAPKMSITGKPISLMNVNRQFRGNAIMEPAPQEGALSDLERLENVYRTMRQQIGESNKRSSFPNALATDNNRLDEAGFMDAESRDNTNFNNCSYSGFAGLILCH